MNPRWAVALGIGIAFAIAQGESARADRLTEVPDTGPTLSLGRTLTKNLTLMSNEVGLHLRNLSGDLIDMQLDVDAKAGKLNLGGGDSQLGLKINSDLEFRGKIVRVRAKVDLGIAGNAFTLELPDFEVTPDVIDGKTTMQLRLPILEGTF